MVSCDGNWKLQHRHCLMIVEELYPLQEIQEYFPLVCTEEPAPNSGFCQTHSKLVQSCGYPSNLREFIRSCGANDANYTKNERSKVREVLKQILKTNPDGEETERAESAQGTGYLLRNREITSSANLTLDCPDEDTCSKDTGEHLRLHNWTRGIFQVVGPGGIIHYWTNLYTSRLQYQK